IVPGSTLRYGSSFCRETVRWPPFRMFPMDAAVIPLPSEETTPPVTKTYFDIDDLQGGFSNLTGSGPAVNIGAPPAPSARGPQWLGFWLGLWLPDHDLRLVLEIGRA